MLLLYVGCLKHFFFGIYGESISRYMIFKIYLRYLYHISLWSYVTLCWSICWVLGSQNSGIGAGAWDGLSIGGWTQAALGDLGRSGLWNGWAWIHKDGSPSTGPVPWLTVLNRAAGGHVSCDADWSSLVVSGDGGEQNIWNLYESLTYKQFHSDI